MCHHTRRCALTLSPCGPHHFTHHRGFQISDLQSESLFEVSMRTQNLAAGLFSVALVVARESQISSLKSQSQTRPTWSKASDLRLSGAPPLAGSLPCGVRTFLSFASAQNLNNEDLRVAKQRSPDLLTLQSRRIIANGCSTGTVRNSLFFKLAGVPGAV